MRLSPQGCSVLTLRQVCSLMFLIVSFLCVAAGQQGFAHIAKKRSWRGRIRTAGGSDRPKIQSENCHLDVSRSQCFPPKVKYWAGDITHLPGEVLV